jgi:hypothetical protein
VLAVRQPQPLDSSELDFLPFDEFPAPEVAFPPLPDVVPEAPASFEPPFVVPLAPLAPPPAVPPVESSPPAPPGGSPPSDVPPEPPADAPPVEVEPPEVPPPVPAPAVPLAPPLPALPPVLLLPPLPPVPGSGRTMHVPAWHPPRMPHAVPFSSGSQTPLLDEPEMRLHA